MPDRDVAYFMLRLMLSALLAAAAFSTLQMTWTGTSRIDPGVCPVWAEYCSPRHASCRPMTQSKTSFCAPTGAPGELAVAVLL
jgi:hypothetical protein